MELSREDFDSIRHIIKDRSGICLGDTKISFLKSKLAQRLRNTNTETVKDYYYYLKYDSNRESELDYLIEAIAIGETYFFRHVEQLGDFSDQIAPEILGRRKSMQTLAVWSAGCSTGEEAYTLAMLLLESPCKIQPGSIYILASDISPAALHSAREGIYDDYSVRHVPKYFLENYFDRNREGKHAIKPQLKQIVRFASINLLDSRSMGRVRNMDCIFCRNVMIYFDDRDKGRCAENLYESLNSDGYLLLGHSESLGRITNLFEPAKLKQTVVYRKSGHSIA